MADLPPARPASDIPYRPISGLALVGLALSLIFAGIVAITTIAALVQGRPVFLPGWTSALAVGAAVLSLVASFRIRNSEGSLAGAGLARWGLWLSVLLGVTYFVYVWVTGLALAKQAHDFLVVKSSEDSGFFPRLQNSEKNRADLYQAFLLTLPTTARGGSKASNEAAMLQQYDQPGKEGDGNITKFSKHPVIYLLRKNPDAVIEQLGGLDWNYEKNSYNVTRTYRFTTPEVVMETLIPVQSTEGAAEGEQRKWFVNLAMIPRPVTTATPLGIKVAILRRSARDFLDERRAELSRGQSDPVYREADTDWSHILPRNEAAREHLKKTLPEIFEGKRKLNGQLGFQADDMYAYWTKAADGRIQVTHPLRMNMHAAVSFPGFLIDLEVTATTKRPIDLSGDVQPPVDWEVSKIRVARVVANLKG